MNDAGMRPEPLTISRLFNAPPQTLFRAWSHAEYIKKWFCPEDCSLTAATVDFRLGGAFDVCMRLPDGTEHWVRSLYTALATPERLAFTSRVSENGRPIFNCETTAVFTAQAGGTRLDVRQSYEILDPVWAKAAAGAQIGWASSLDRLAAQLARLQSPAVHGSFTLERVFAAAPAQVFFALTDLAAKDKWFRGGPEQVMVERFMDVKPGGRERAYGKWPNGNTSRFDAVYFDVIPDRRLVYAYEMHLNGIKISVSLATLELSLAAGGTKLVITEQGSFLEGYQDAGSREQGTGFLLDQLGTSLGGAPVNGSAQN
jgi:uncharacterized protein YndB with AHSA1/START domain